MIAAAGLAGPATGSRRLILASGSRTRAALLAGAGVDVAIEKPAVDEEAVKAALRGEGAPAVAVAETLAELKAQRVSRRHAQAFVIGADQMLDCGGVWFDKPADRAHAEAHLMALRGREHELISAVTVVCDGSVLWQHADRARLHMRRFDDGFIAAYLDAVGDRALESVGAYQLEGLGAHLFERIEGDYFSILGLPLLPLLDFLRNHGLVKG